MELFTALKNHINQTQEQAKIRRLYEHNLDFGALLPVERFINDRMAVQETLHISNVSFCDVFRCELVTQISLSASSVI